MTVEQERLEQVARAVYDELEGPIANQDAVRQHNLWEQSKRIASVAIKAIGSTTIAPTKIDSPPIPDQARRHLHHALDILFAHRTIMPFEIAGVVISNSTVLLSLKPATTDTNAYRS
jgi:hypothetical protein